MRKPLFLAGVVSALVMSQSPVSAQNWDTPLFSSPESTTRWEGYVADAHGTGMAFILGWRPGLADSRFRVRLGVADGQGTGLITGGSGPPHVQVAARSVAFMGGIDYSAPLVASSEFPLAVNWIAGLGVGVNRGTLVSAPLGVTIGFSDGTIRPYITPRLVVEHRSVSGLSSTRASSVVDWGIDVRLPLGGSFGAAVTTGEWRGVVLGLSF